MGNVHGIPCRERQERFRGMSSGVKDLTADMGLAVKAIDLNPSPLQSAQS